MIMMMAVTVTVMVSGEGVEDGYGGARMVMQMVAMTLMIMMSMTTMILMLLMRVMRVIMASMDADIGLLGKARERGLVAFSACRQ